LEAQQPKKAPNAATVRRAAYATVAVQLDLAIRQREKNRRKKGRGRNRRDCTTRRAP
jgi:hypothetical protein